MSATSRTMSYTLMFAISIGNASKAMSRRCFCEN
jgi:hypothetical protein